MRRKHVLHCLWAGMGACGLIYGTVLSGENPTPPAPASASTPPAASESPRAEIESGDVLRELSKIRQQVGLNVLDGTLLDAPAEETNAEFARGVRKALGLPEKAVKTSEQAAAQGAKTLSEIARTLRHHAVRLDRIASELEESKQYANADQLRETARELRLVARRFVP